MSVLHSTPGMRERDVDLGLLVLRGAALLLALTFGWTKLMSIGSLGLAPLIREVGFPAPALASVYVSLCESVGALTVACGLFTRFAAACVVLSMSGALYYSLHVGEESARAVLYWVTFATLALAGPGRYSVDQWRRSRAP